ncbi:hypothetical protein BSLG_003107 [Batrachochytrium salamandrivorans]|nr:hypothetical protein BSLG_003107 [Batrachochytrium salamandrivorans]
MTLAKEFLKFVDASLRLFMQSSPAFPLRSAGFTEIKEAAVWTTRTAAAANDSNQCAILPGGKYFFTRNKSAIIAFCVGGRYAPSSGFSIIGAHTDSPCLKVKPRSKREKSACVQVGVELYGGGLWHTWFDRDLSVAGRVLVREAAGSEEAHTYSHRLVKIDKALLRIPTLAIHLDRSSSDGLSKKDQGSDVGTLHHPMLLKELASDMNVDVANICDFELCLYDTQPASIGGANGEFIHTARLDNLMMSYCALNAIIDSNDSLLQDTKIRVVALFDNEEVGSQTAHGANSNFMEVTLRRLSEMDIGASAEAPAGARYERSMVNSLQSSPTHQPGVVVKQNANQRYATTAVSTLILREAARKAAGGAVPLQEFVVRNDSPCGSTIGPMLSSSLGVRTVDVGNPQWSMHSIRETCGVTDVDYAVNLFKSFFDNFADIDSRIPRL